MDSSAPLPKSLPKSLLSSLPKRWPEDALRRALLSQLEAHHPADVGERDSLLRLMRWVDSASTPFARSNRTGHVTASAVVLDGDARALLLLHRSLGRWLQPGGHLDPGEAPWDGALREAREESGLPDLRWTDGYGARILDVDVHWIPEAPVKGEPAHEHLDVCFVVRTASPESAVHLESESRALRWVTAEEAEALELETVTRRRLRKAFAIELQRPED